jgi:transcriptional regulator with XRE-family HTH domain
MSYDKSDWERVARAVTRRREDLGLTQADVSHVGGFSLDRVSAIERARSLTYRSGTLRALERALGWGVRSIEAILEGGEPTLLPDFTGPQGQRVEAKHAEAGAATGRASALDASVRVRGEVDFGIGDAPPFSEPRDDTEHEANETWQAAKTLERIMKRQRERERHRRKNLGDVG